MAEPKGFPSKIQTKLIVKRVFKNTTWHGWWHVSEYDKRQYLETIFWIVMNLLFLVLCIWLTTHFWIRYLTNPTVITIERDYLNWNITFPPLTVCLHDRLNRSAMIDLMRERNFNETQMSDPTIIEFFEKLVFINTESLKEFTMIEQEHFVVDEFLDILLRVSNRIPGNTIFSLAHERIIFTEFMTADMGLCYTFNSKLAPFMSPKYIISPNETVDLSQKLLQINYLDGDTIAIIEDMSINGDIYLHGPNYIPTLLSKIPNSELRHTLISLVFRPIITQSTESIRNLFVFQRKCLFEDESYLEFFPQMYTYDLCAFECAIKNLIKECGCVPFFMKRIGNIKSCQMEELNCVYNIKIVEIFDPSTIPDCGCLKNCNDIKYGLEDSSLINWFENSKISWGMKQTKIRYKRDLIFGFINALISTGSNFNLFLGGSFLSLIEIFFFFYRVICYYLHTRKMKKNSRKQLVKKH